MKVANFSKFSYSASIYFRNFAIGIQVLTRPELNSDRAV